MSLSIEYDGMGKKAHDTITGFNGTITGLCQYLGGSNQVRLEAPMGSDGKCESRWIEVMRIELDETPTS